MVEKPSLSAIIGAELPPEYEKVGPEHCKDDKGNWTKWVIERCSPEQVSTYKELNRLILEENECVELGIQPMSEN
jgi:hypothetical protein